MQPRGAVAHEPVCPLYGIASHPVEVPNEEQWWRPTLLEFAALLRRALECSDIEVSHVAFGQWVFVRDTTIISLREAFYITRVGGEPHVSIERIGRTSSPRSVLLASSSA